MKYKVLTSTIDTAVVDIPDDVFLLEPEQMRHYFCKRNIVAVIRKHEETASQVE